MYERVDKMNKKVILILIIFLMVTQINIGFAEDIDAIDSMIEKHIKNSNLHGIGVGIIKNNELIYKETKGIESDGDKLTSTSPLFVASLSKSMTGLAVMQLVEKDLISLDDPIKKYISYFQVESKELSQNITIKNLLNHQSGLSTSTNLPDTENDASLKERVRALSNLNAVSENGQEFHYFNDNYNILGLLIEEVTGKPYATYMEESIFRPLGMNNTTAEFSVIRGKEVYGHKSIYGFSMQADRDIVRYDIPSGFILTNLNDMVKYLSFLIEKNPKIISDNTFNTMRTAAQNSEYGMGWYIRDINEGKVIEHSGSLPGFNAHLALIPETNSGYVYIMNQNHMFRNINGNLLKVIRGKTDFNHFPFVLVLRIIALILLLLAIKDIWSTFKLTKKQKSKDAWIKGSIKALVMAIFLFWGIPFILTNLLNLNFSYRYVLTYTPGLAIFWFLAIAIQIIRLGISIWKLLIKNDFTLITK